MIIKSVKARVIKDSRREKSIEVIVNRCRASSPSGKSVGSYETPSYRKNIEWNIDFLNGWKDKTEIKNFDDLKKVEDIIKKDANLKDVKKFGANALFAFESAILKALAYKKRKYLWELLNPNANGVPFPVGNIIGGGLHSHNKYKAEFQEFLIIPKEKKFSENWKLMNKFYKLAGRELKSRIKNDEGAWEASTENRQTLNVLDILRKRMKKKIEIGIDVAANSFYKEGKYLYGNKKLNGNSQINYISELAEENNLFYIEDPLNEGDFEGFSKLRKKLKNKLIVGDDLTATQINRAKKAIRAGSVNAMIIKPNQNGSLLEVKEIFELCKKHNVKTIMSHRSGETLDNALSDYAVGFGADYVKAGVATKWRRVKLKRLAKIEKKVKV